MHRTLAILLLCWIVTVGISIFRTGGFHPSFVTHYGNITHLFTHRVNAWAWFEVQARFSGGGGRWVTLRMSDYSGMENYGYLTRLDRILDEVGSPERGPAVRRDLSRWLASSHARRFPESPELREVRFLRVAAPVGSDLLSRPPGRWVRPTLESVPIEWVREIAIVTDRDWSVPVVPSVAQ